MVLMVPEGAQNQLEAYVFDNLTELAGYTYVEASEVEEAALIFARKQGTGPLGEPHVVFGLGPLFADTDYGQWQQLLGQIGGAVTATREVRAPVVDLPLGWAVLATLPVSLSGGAVVRFFDHAAVVAQWDSTRVIDAHGTVADLGVPPFTITHGCCGGTQAFNAGNNLVVTHELGTQTWVFDLESMTWREVDARPTSGLALGAAIIDGNLIIASAAPRAVGPVTSQTVSAVAALDLATGKWRDLGPVPKPISVGGVTDDGTNVFVAGTAQGPNNNIIGSARPAVYRYTTESDWEELPSMPIHGQAATLGWAEGTGLLGWNYDLESALLDESGEWRNLGAVPMDSAECYPRSETVGSGVVGFCGGIAYFEAASQTWHTVPIYYGVASWYGTTDSSVVGLVQVARDKALLIEYVLLAEG